MDDVWVPIIMFMSIAATVIAFMFFASKTRQARQATIQAAIQHGDALTPELVAAISNERSTPAADYRRGVLLIALGIAIAVFGQFVDPDETELVGIAAIPALLGLGYLFVWKFGPKD